jgi:hypothetical protein
MHRLAKVNADSTTTNINTHHHRRILHRLGILRSLINYLLR